MSDVATSGPKVRGNVAKTSKEKKEKAPRKWGKDRKLWIRLSENDSFLPNLMFVEDWEYDEERGGWDYKLRDKDGKVYGLVEETNTKRA